jgi:acyl carrier protein
MGTDIIEGVRRILVLHLGTEESRISKDAKFTELGADSLDIMEIAMSLEESFDISIPDWVADQFVTVGDVISFVEAQIQPSR